MGPVPVEEGVALVSGALSRGSLGPYQLQAATVAVHDEAATVRDTDWPLILALYSLLERMTDSPMMLLNQAIAAAMVHGPTAGLGRLEVLDSEGRLAGHYRLDAVRAHLLERAGGRERAILYYRAAAERTASAPERDYLILRAAWLAAWMIRWRGRSVQECYARRSQQPPEAKRLTRISLSPEVNTDCP